MKNRILSEEKLYSGWSTLYRFKIDVSDDPDEPKVVTREVYDSGDGASVFLYNSATKKVILTRQFRIAAKAHGHNSGMIIETCAGLLDELSPEEAIKKEILEETGIKVRKVEKVMETYATPGAHMEKIWLFTAEYRDEDKVTDGGGLSEEHEDIEVLEYTYAEVLKLYNDGKLEDSKTIILIQYAILNGLIA